MGYATHGRAGAIATDWELTSESGRIIITHMLIRLTGNVVPMLTEHEAMERLKAAIAEAGSQQAFAKKHHLAGAYISDVLRGKRALAPAVLAVIGLERVVLYQETGDKDE